MFVVKAFFVGFEAVPSMIILKDRLCLVCWKLNAAGTVFSVVFHTNEMFCLLGWYWKWLKTTALLSSVKLVCIKMWKTM